MKKNAWKIILAIAVLVCIVCLGRFGWIKYQDHKTEQAIERAGTKAGNKGYDCALSAIEMVQLIKEVEA